jgi:hypothetical protein
LKKYSLSLLSSVITWLLYLIKKILRELNTGPIKVWLNVIINPRARTISQNYLRASSRKNV